VDVGDPAVLALRYDWRNNSVFFLHNLAATAREVLFQTGIEDGRGSFLVNLLGSDHSALRGREALRSARPLRLPLVRVGGLDYLMVLDRTGSLRAGEAGLSRIAAVGEEPVHGMGYPVAAGLDAAVAGSVVSKAGSGSGGSAKKASTSASIAGRLAFSARR
jgi:hypothetical protein